MPRSRNQSKIGKTLAIAAVFILLLTGSRILWNMTFLNTNQHHAMKGQLDLRNWDAAKSRPITLDGEWEFYPHTWLKGHGISAESHAGNPEFLQVPGNWNASLQPGIRTPYGYGSYRLRILLNPDQDYTYAIRVSSVRSSSELYINGRLAARSGSPAEKEQDYSARNLPYSASFSSNGSREIDVVVQAANYKDPRDSGIVRSMEFGTEDALARETRLSTAMQLLVAIVFLLHALYAIILFLIGARDPRFFYFSLLTVSAMFINLLGSDEKILSDWFPISYEWGFKSIHLAMAVVAFSLIQFVKSQFSVSWRRALSGYAILCGFAALLPLLLNARNVTMLQPLFLGMTWFSILVAIVAMLRASVNEFRGSIWLPLSFIAAMNHFLWWGINLTLGIKIVYYPFDLIVSTACFASVWINHYFQVYAESKRLSAELQETDKRKDEFLANTSHELRNPLHSMLNLSRATLDRERPSLTDKSIKDMETVLSVGRRMSLLLSDLLDVMSLKEGAPRLQLRRFSIQPIATGVVDMLHSMTDGKPVRLTNRIPERFPQVYADENRVIQILFNLLHNAVKYTNEGEVSIRGQAKDGKALIAVSDTGIGMDEETLRRAFEPYEQGHSDRTIIEGGFGLGLSICKKLVELHGGTLQAHSVPGRGSEFVFALPLAEPATAQDESEPAAIAEIAVAAAAEPMEVASSLTPDSKPGRSQRMSADRPRILLVDDDPVNLNVLVTILSAEHYDMTAATSGSNALAVLDSKEWDLLITDVMMPQMSGYELTRTVRERFTVTELPILLLTARSRPEDIENGFLSGANDYVTKPVDALEIRSRVKALTDVKRSARERLHMEAAWLQAQIQPHFLFNTLNTVIALSEIDTDRMRKLLDAFSHFLRDKFRFETMDELAPLEEELGIVRSYLYIERERFDDRLQVVWEIDECEQMKIPMLTIQPLVENAVRHGIMQRAQGGTVRIRVSNYGSYAEITVGDNGVGMEEETVRRLLEKRSDRTSGVGLLNTDLRLKRRFGKGLQIKSKPGRGTSISFVIYPAK